MAYTERGEDTVMKTMVEVVYENGVFRPTEPVAAPEGTRATVTLPLVETSGDPAAAPKPTPYEIMAEIAALYEPEHDPYVGWSHDEVLYGRSDTDGVR
jgi:predicted DNA-binding antitoxin AbrB/MazE fold protein